MTHNYPEWAVLLAQARGYDEMAHIAALGSGDEDQISLTHPYNWLHEDEVDTIDRMLAIRRAGGTLHPYEAPEGGDEPAATDR